MPVVADRADVIVGQLSVAFDEVVAHGADIALDGLFDLGNDVLEVLFAVACTGGRQNRRAFLLPSWK